MSGVPPPPPSPHISHLSFFFFLLLPAAVTSAGESVRNTSVPQCYSVDCGGVEIRYPFWLLSSETNTSYCGYPHLGIDCQDGKPVLKLGNVSYRVADVSYNTSTLTLQDMDLLGSDCPRARHNLTLVEGVPLSLTGADAHLFFFFNCSGDFPRGIELPCLSENSGGKNSYVFLDGTIPTVLYPWSLCQDYVLAPVLRTGIPGSVDLLSSFGGILRRGFQLTWQLPDRADCRSCEMTGGNCGFSNNQDVQGYDFLCFCNNGARARSCSAARGRNTMKKIMLGIIAGTSGFLLSFIIFYCWYKTHHRDTGPFWNRKSKNTQNVEAFLEQYGSLVPRRYSYAEVKKMTKSFSEKLGQGGYGIVFKGKLLDSHLVAVKVLRKSEGNGEEFINEVASVGRTHHVNIVSLLGFCCEGSKRALIYEFMHNGSLDKFIFSKEPRDMTPLRWEKLYDIAIGIARGLEYLHRGCNTRIVHFDIKPHNILLDEDFCPKISDFGLSKSCHPKQSILSVAGARGTIGYIAPEVFSRNFGVVTSKSDVYSYGMMILEMVGGGRTTDARSNSEMYFPHWIYEHLDEGGVLKRYGVTIETEEIAKKMILVGLWCIQTNPSCRPSMNKIVEMLEGNVRNLQMPPKPYLSSPLRSNINSPTQSTS